MSMNPTLVTAHRIATDPQLTTAEKVQRMARFQIRYTTRHDYDRQTGWELMRLTQSLIEDLHFERQFEVVDELGPERE